MNQFYKSQVLLCIIIALAVLITGCNAEHSINSDIYMDIQLEQNGRITKIYDAFNGIERGSLEVDDGQRIFFEYEVIVQKGRLIIKWLDSSGAVVWQKVLSENASGTKEIVCETQGSYTIIVQGLGTGGSFNITWDGT